MTYEDFMQTTRLSLATAYVALQAHQKMQDGRGAPDLADMRRYIEDAEALVELYEEAIDDRVHSKNNPPPKAPSDGE